MSRSTISTFQLFEMFPDAESARRFLESRLWPDGAICPACKASGNITTRKGGFYRCNPCKLDFTIRTGTVFERSHIPLHKWLYAMYLLVTARKGISSMQLAKEIGIRQSSAWFMLHRLREACGGPKLTKLRGIVELDECFIGGKERNKHEHKKLKAGRGSVGKTAVGVAQTPTPPTNLPVTATSYVQYPSLNPVTAISMHIGTFGTPIYDIIQKKVDETNWNCASPEFYKVVVVDSSLKVLRQLNVTAVRPIGNDPNHVRYTRCEGHGHPAIVDLVLGSQVNSGELLQVFVYDDTKQNNLLISSDGKLAVTTSSFPTFTAAPQAAPGEALTME